MTFSTTMRVQTPHFVAGLVLEGGYVQKAAPILRYMLGWERGKVQRYCSSKRWVVEEQKQP